MRNVWGIHAAVVVALLMTACGALPQSNLDTRQTSGQLDVQIRGLPEAVDAAVNVTGPDGFSEQLTGSGILNGLLPGTYSLAAGTVPDYEPEQTVQSVLVEAGATALANVAYRAAETGDPDEQDPPDEEPPGQEPPLDPDPREPVTGNVSIIVSGQPEATPLTVTLAGPEDTLDLNGNADLQDLPTGDYNVTASRIEGYTATVRPAAFTLGAGTHIVVTVEYHLPGQEPSQPQFTVDWPHEPFIRTLGGGFEFVVTFSGDAVLADGYILTRSGPADHHVEFDYLDGSTVHVRVSDNGALPGLRVFNLAAYHHATDQLEILPIQVDVQLLLTTHLDALEPEPGMLRYLIQDPRSEGGSIDIAPDFVAQQPAIALVDQLYLGHDLTLNGAGLQLDADGQDHRVMEIGPEATVSISDLSLLNGTSDTGGNLKVDGHLTMSGSQILGGTTLTTESNWDVAGGGIFVGRGATLIVSGSLIEGNHSARGAGGGIMNFGQLSINDTIVRGNHGDGITSSAGTLNLHRVQVTEHLRGSAVQITEGEAVIASSRIWDNRTIGQGGGINNAGSLIVRDTEISANMAGDRGGGIANRAMGTVLVERSQIQVNQSLLGGGGIYNVGFFSLLDSEVIQNVTGENPANIGGAGIMHEPIFSSGVMDIVRTRIGGNYSVGHGAGVASLGHLNLIDSYLELNYTIKMYGGQGAGLYIGYSTSSPELPLVTVSGSTFHDNYADSRGGGIAIAGPMDLSLDMSRVAGLRVINSTLFDNHAEGHGGGLSVSGAVSLLELAGVTIVGNSSGAQGGGIHSSTVPVKMGWSLLANNLDRTPWPDSQTGFGTIIRSQGNNLYSQEPLWSNLHSTDRVMANPPLAATLANNGGPTLTLLPGTGLAGGSMCGTAGFLAVEWLYDQRGFTRYGTLNCTPGAVVLQ